MLLCYSCQACNCDVAGSLSANCHQTSGKCSCKQYVEGNKCDRCVAGFSYLQASNALGCSARKDYCLHTVLSSIFTVTIVCIV